MPSTKIVVTLPDEVPYDVRIGSGVLDKLGEHMRVAGACGGAQTCAQSGAGSSLAGASSVLASATRALVITDSNVAPLYLARTKAALMRAGFRVSDIVVPAGEDAKSLAVAGEIWEAMAGLALGRDCVVVALGGGVVGDLAGFVAATYMRGVSVVQVPTTLLAMVDSSVGGKTAINLEAGKNLVGAFKQPSYVCADTDVLETLPDREWVCGCAEIAKASVIDSDDFFFWLTESAASLAAREPATTAQAISRAVVFKADVVACDKTESCGVRECLNYGHTLGHAIELLAGYGTYSHGAAVAEGMRFAARLGESLVGTPHELTLAQDELLDTLGACELDWLGAADEVLDAMKRDKKARAGQVRFVLPRDVGAWELVEVDNDVLLAHLNNWARAKSEREA